MNTSVRGHENCAGTARAFRSLVLLGSFLVCMCFHAQAALLGVGGNSTNWPGVPDLASGSLQVTYTLNSATTGVLTVLGTTTDYWDLQTNDNLVIDSYNDFTPGLFTLSATVKTNGTFLSGTVSLSCTGGVYDPYFDPTPIIGPGTLLQGNLTALGFLGASGENDSHFDFKFSVTGGELASVYGLTAGTALDTGDQTFGGSFTSGFSNGGQGFADTLMMIPEPEPQFLVILSVLGLCWVARRRAPLRKG